jgi:PPM family protein phosphatase
MRAFGATDVGRQRGNNEDAFSILTALNAAILADGMGGENCGEVGSAVTVETVSQYLRAPEAGLSTEAVAKEAIRAANSRVLQTARDRKECDGMGSTVVLALWHGTELVIANVGDSRAYLYRGGKLQQLTYDQNFANELRTRLGFSEDRLRSMPNRNVLTMAVGIFEEVLIRTHVETLQPGDQVLLCSDGLYGPVLDDAIAKTLAGAESAEEKVRGLIAMANENGGPDNVTAVLLEYAGGSAGS